MCPFANALALHPVWFFKTSFLLVLNKCFNNFPRIYNLKRGGEGRKGENSGLVLLSKTILLH